MKKNKYRKTKKGFSLIELLLVLSIIAALSVIAFKVFTTVENNRLADTYVQKLNIIKSNADTMFNIAGRAKINNNTMSDSAFASQLISGSGYTKNYQGIAGYYIDTKTLISVQAMPLNNSNFVIIGFRFPVGMCTSFINELVASQNYLISMMNGDIYGGGITASNLNNAESGMVTMSKYKAHPTVSDVASSCAAGEKLMASSTPGWNAVNIYISV